MKILSGHDLAITNANSRKANKIILEAQKEFTNAATENILPSLPADIGLLIGTFLTRKDGAGIAQTCSSANSSACLARRGFFSRQQFFVTQGYPVTRSDKPIEMMMPMVF